MATNVVLVLVVVVSGVPRILEWEGSRSYRLRRGGVWGGGIPGPLPTEGRVSGVGCPQKIFRIFC